MAEKKTRIKLLTPVGRLSFPAIFEKERLMEGATGEPKYAATIIFDKAYIQANKDELARYNAIRAEAERVCKGKFKKPLKDAVAQIPRFWNPFRQGEEKDHLDGYGAGTVFFKASGKRKPGVVGPDSKTPILDKEALYSGCYIRLSVSPYSFDNKMKGIGIGLNNVMFVRDGERLDGGSDPTEDFGEVAVDTDDFGASGGDVSDDEPF
jgi:hypothetical protein